MPFCALDDLAAGVFGERVRAECHALIKFDIVSDRCRFADHHAGAVVDEEPFADGRAGMDVDCRNAVRVFGHDARNHGDPSVIKNMRNALDRDGFESGITDDDFVERPCGGVAVVCCLNIFFDDFPQTGQGAEQFFRCCQSLLSAGAIPAGFGQTAMEVECTLQNIVEFDIERRKHFADRKPERCH